MPLTKIEELTIEEKIKILRAPLPQINFVKPAIIVAGASTYKSPERKLDE